MSHLTDIPEQSGISAFLRQWLDSPLGRALAASRKQGVAVTDADKLIVWANRGYEMMTGYRLEELVGKSPGALLQGPGTDSAAVARMRRHLRAREPACEELLNYRKSGEVFWKQVMIEPVLGDGGALDGFIGMTTEITGRKLLESEVERRQVSDPAVARLYFPLSDPDQLAKPLSSMVLVVDTAGLIRHACRGALALLDFSYNDLVHQRNLCDLVSPNLDCYQTFVRTLLGGRPSGSQELSLVSRRGREVRVLATAIELKSPTGVICGHSFQLSECTSRRALPEVPEARETRKAGPRGWISAESLLTGSVFRLRVGPDRSPALNLLPESAAAAKPGVRTLLSAIDRTGRQRLYHKFRRSHEDLRPVSVLCRLRQTDSHAPPERWVRILATPERAADGDTVWHGYFVDVSKRILTERALDRKSRLLRILVDVATRFLGSPTAGNEATIEDALGMFGRFFGVDRTYIVRYDWDAGTASNTHEWVAEGVASFKEMIQDFPVAGMEKWAEVHRAGRTLGISDTRMLEDSPLRDFLHTQDIRSFLTVPMLLGRECIGFVGLDGVRHPLVFGEDEVSLLRVFAEVLVSLHQRGHIVTELEESRQRFLDVIAAAGEYVWEIDTDGRFTYVSERSFDVLGHQPERLLGKAMDSLLLVSEREEWQIWLESLMEAPRPFYGREFVIAFSEGRTAVHMMNGLPVFAKDGQVIGYRGLGLDITREARLSDSLRDARDQINIFFDLSLELLIITDLEGRVIRMGKAWERLLGVPVHELRGRRVREFVYPPDWDATAGVLLDLRNNSRVQGFENRWVTADKSLLHLEWSAVRHQNLVFACAHDMTERKLAEKQLQQALANEKTSSEIKSRLITMASHEFRTPLASIRLASEMMLHGSPGKDAATAKKLNTIISKTGFLESVVSDILDLERGRDRGRPGDRLDLALAPLSRVVEEVTSELDTPLVGKDRICCRLGSCASASVAGNLVGRILRNLLENALKYSPAASPVTLEAIRAGNLLEIRVSDTGKGVPPEEEDSLFDEFYRGDNATFLPGTGLGLPIARNAAEHLGGQLTYHRQASAGITSFILKIPYHER